MRLAIIILMAGMMQVSASVYSQATTFSFALNDKQIIDVLNEIESQSEYHFFYQNEQIDIHRKLDLDITKKTIEEVLDVLFTDQEVDYKVYDDNLILLVSSDVENKERITVPSVSNAAQRKIEGHVTNNAGESLPGVTVAIQGTSNGTITDADGFYSLPGIEAGDILVYSFIGMKTLTVVVEDQTIIDITMTEEAIGLAEVVTIGYGTLKKSDLTGAIAQIDPTKMEARLTSNPTELLRNNIAGLYIPISTNAKGSVNMSDVLVRGTNSLKASNSPLIVVDGMIYNGDLANISSSDIARIDVMKDASSAAIYGSRSANGVISITTKKGNSGAPTISFTHNSGLATPSFLRPVLGPEEYLGMREKLLSEYIAVREDDPGFYANPDNLPAGVTVEDWMGYTSSSGDPSEVWLRRLQLQNTEVNNYLAGNTVNWGDQVFQTGMKMDDQISIAGGTEKLKYYWSANYTGNEGFVVGDEYESVRSRLNLESEIADFLTVGINAQFATRDESSIPVGWSSYYSASPYGSIYEEDGTTLQYYVHDYPLSINPLNERAYTDRYRRSQDLNSKIFAIVDLPFNFTYQVNVINSFMGYRSYEHDYAANPANANGGESSRANASTYSWTIDNILKWNKSFGAHDFDITLMANAEKLQYWSDQMINSLYFPSDVLSYHALHIGQDPRVSSNDKVYTRDAMLGRLNYIYGSKYYLTLALRRDGYSAFGQDNPRALFPTAALAWKISEEDFFDVSSIDFLKARMSWGANGNSAIGTYSALAAMESAKYLYTNPTTGSPYTTSVLRLTNMANAALQWEKTTAFNAGIDFGLMKNRITGSLEGYISQTTGLLVDRSLPSITGFTSVVSNLGQIDNQGVEFVLNTINMEKGTNFIWRSGFNCSYNRNKITHLYGDMVDVLDDEGNVTGQKEVDDYENRWFIGESIDAVWDYKPDGVWQMEDEELAYDYGGYLPGEFKMVDVNGDTAFTDLEDRQILGLSKPSFRWYLNNEFVIFRDFSFSFSIYGHHGHIANFMESAGSNNFNAYVMPYWTPENRSNIYPRMAGDHEGRVRGTNYVRLDFIRINDIAVGYTFPDNICQKMHLKNLKVYASISNVYLMTKWPGWDPEHTGGPSPRYFNLGANIKL